jgi:hypothetical protein
MSGPGGLPTIPGLAQQGAPSWLGAGIPDLPGLPDVGRTTSSVELRLDRVSCGPVLYDRQHAHDDRPRRVGPATFFARASGLFEIYEHRPQGVEQSFLLEQKPALTEDLVLESVLRTSLTPQAIGDGKRGVTFLDPSNGQPVIGFSAVTVIDANGATLTSSVSVAENTLTIRIPQA